MLQPNIGGLRQYFHRLFRELLATDYVNQYTFFYGENNVSEMEEIGNNRWKESAILVQSEGDILPLLGTIDLYFCPFHKLWPRPLPVASVVQLADIQEVYFPDFFNEAAKHFRKMHYAPSTQAADAVITLSEFSKRSITEHHHIPSEKIFVTPLVSDSSFDSSDEHHFPLPFELPDKFIFYPANHWLHKNHDTLLKALKYIREERGVTIPCIFTGFIQDHDNGYPLKDKIDEYGLQGLSTVLGYISQQELNELYKRAVLMCFPSLFEGFGMPILEAMRSGCPVVCSNVTSVPEVAGDAAIYFNPTDAQEMGNAILAMWNSQELRNDLTCRGLVRSQLFTADKMAQVHLVAFEYAYASFNEESRKLFRTHLYEPLFRCNEVYSRMLQIESSFSWRLTSPLRWLAKIFINGEKD
jgi:glycosyltransferase involved in cell wall biosynthesis